MGPKCYHFSFIFSATIFEHTQRYAMLGVLKTQLTGLVGDKIDLDKSKISG